MRVQTLLFEPVREVFDALVSPHRPAPRWTLWEVLVLGATSLVALLLGVSNLGGPSLWHDELVHVYVAKQIAASAWPALPSGNFYPSSSAYNVLLAVFVKLLGDAESVVRLPSVVLGVCNVMLVYWLTRNWLGRPTAIAAALFFALSPWHVAWMRQARLYEFQVTSYLLLLHFAWRFFTAEPEAAFRSGMIAIGAYFLGILTSFHSILYLGAVGVFALGLGFQCRKKDLRWAWAVAACAAIGMLTILCFWLNPNPVDRAAVFQTGLGGELVDHTRADRYYYFHFLANNLSLGFFVVATVGAFSLLARRDRESLWVLLGFLVPVLILTYLVGYRRFRFMYFAYPLYVMISAHGLLVLLAVIGTWRRSLVHGVCAILIVLFVGRLAVSMVALTGDSLEAASGADTTLAIKHPKWRKAGHWVREHRMDTDALLTTTYLPALYYAGRVDNWFPNRYTRWERQESGMEGLGSLDELKSFLAEHPRGYFIAEASRFMFWSRHGDLIEVLRSEFEWVEANMTRVEEASSEDDVCVWRWDFTRDGVP